jgi:hypothetical protein
VATNPGFSAPGKKVVIISYWPFKWEWRRQPYKWIKRRTPEPEGAKEEFAQYVVDVLGGEPGSTIDFEDGSVVTLPSRTPGSRADKLKGFWRK